MSQFTDSIIAAANGAAGFTAGSPDALTRTTWREVHRRARLAAEALIDSGLRPGGAVAVLAGRPSDLAPVVQGVWLAGGSITMLHQPTARTDLSTFAAETATVLGVIDAQLVIVGEPFEAAASALAAGGVTVVTMSELNQRDQDADALDALPEIAEDATALLQLTSGSTATPKAVRITHANLWANLTAMVDAAGLTTDDVMVSWLPLFHDMGMVGFLTLPMCCGIELVKVTPTDFLRGPLLWPQLISTYRGTVTAAPNFAYAITAKALARAENLDLSSLRFALNGAEPIDIGAVTAFLAAGQRFGLGPDTMVPAYGMAETTLGVSFHPWGTPIQVDRIDAQALENQHLAIPVADSDGTGSTQVREFAVLGPPLAGIEVAVRADGGAELAERQVGTLFVRGAAVTDQYLTVDGPVPTRGPDSWLDTGDLGYLVDGRVVVCGRSKDVIIMGGRNIFPTDIERIAQGVEGVRAGNAAAVRWQTTSGRESFAVVVESKFAENPDVATTIADAVRSAVTAAVGARPALVTVVPGGRLPKTPSGKIRRAAAAELLKAQANQVAQADKSV